MTDKSTAKTGKLECGQSRMKKLTVRVASATGMNRKQSAIAIKTQLEELRLENTSLKGKLESESEERMRLSNVLQSLMIKVVEYVDVKEFDLSSDSIDATCDDDTHDGKSQKIDKMNNSSKSPDFTKLPTEKVLDMFVALLEEKFSEGSDVLAARMEELETRVTVQSHLIANQTLVNLQLREGIEDIVRCNTMKDVTQKVHTIKLATSTCEPCPVFSACQPSDASVSPAKNSSDENDGSSHVKAQEINISSGKYPGECHIRYLHPDVKEAIIQGLSLYKVNGADWRIFAERVGMSEELLAHWTSQRLRRPMEHVLSMWGRSQGATVRMLHRHLISPQLRCRILAKRVADLYSVD